MIVLSLQEFNTPTLGHGCCLTVTRQSGARIVSKIHDELTPASVRRVSRYLARHAKKITTGRVGDWQVWLNATF